MSSLTQDILKEFGLHKAEMPATFIRQQPTQEDSIHANSSYDGDAIDNSPPLRDGWQTLNYSDPSELVNFYDEFLRDQVVTQHPWQIEIAEEIARGPATQVQPYKIALRAANGSGKDKYVIAPFAIWFALCKVQSRCIITSSSGNQLTAQTETYIKDLAERVNQYHGEQIFRIRQRFIKCNLSGSEIRLFATDEAGKAEGYHPITPVSEMAIVINEAKSVAEEIFGALRRCTGYNYWIEVSTPGEPAGHFYNSCTNAKLRYRTRVVTSYDCPHLNAEEREIDKLELGEHSALFRSKHLALFTSLGGSIIIPLELIDKNRRDPCDWLHRTWQKRVGIDLAAGGDENAIYILQGNKIVASLCFRETDTTLTAQLIADFLDKNKIPKNYKLIFADDGGVGHSILDMLEHHYKFTAINRIFNQGRALDNRMYGNMGAQNWYRVARLFEENLLVLPDDEILVKQLTSRFYKKKLDSGKIYLESKKEAKANGRPSPDRADAYILAFCDLTVEDFFKAAEEESKPVFKGYSPDELADKVEYADYGKPRAPLVHAHKFNVESKLELN